MLHQHHEDHMVEEFRDIVRKRYGGASTGPAEGETYLANVERLATLHAIAHNPYHQLVFGGVSTLDLMRICAFGLIERLDYRAAGKLLKDIAQLANAKARKSRSSDAPPPAEPEPDPEPEPAPREVFKLDPEAMPVLPPPLTDNERELRALSDRELRRRLALVQRHAAQRATFPDRTPGADPPQAWPTG